MELEMTIRHVTSSVIQELQDKGLLLTQSEVAEYRELKRSAQDCFLTGKAAGDMLGLSSASVTLLRQQNKLKGYWVGKRWKYKKSEIEKYAKGN